MKVQAIIPTAGSGKRFKSTKLKSLAVLKGVPVFIHTLRAFDKAKKIDSIICVGPKEHTKTFNSYLRKYKIKKVVGIIEGGATRAQSVFNGIGQLDADTTIVVIHDGVRPFIEPQIIDKAIALCDQYDGVVVGVPVKPTIKVIDHNFYVKETLDRNQLWEVQTPQVFKKDILIKGHQKNKDPNATDDSILVERIGGKVKILMGSYKNIKITTVEDFHLAKILIKKG